MKKVEPEAPRVCSLCHKVVPSAKHAIVSTKEGKIALCTDGETSCYDEFYLLETTKDELAHILFLTGKCKSPRICFEEIRRINKLDEIRKLITRIIKKLKEATDFLKNMSVAVLEELYTRLSRLVELLRLPEEVEVAFVI